jgi:argininosuccinate lyase
MSSGSSLQQNTQAAVLEIGERLTEAPSRSLTDIVFRRELQAQQDLTRMIGRVDLAHTLTLAEHGTIPEDAVRALIAALLALDESPPSFVPTADKGDLYTNREAWLTEHSTASGWLGVARARREALTTAYHLVLCEEILGLGEALADAAKSLAAASVRYRDSLMPDYTYLQAAQPTSFGHYLQAFAWPIMRDLDRIRALYQRVDRCPAGIGSSNGSVTWQDRRRLAERLGFREPVRHARDAMWQADLALEAVGAALAATVNFDRLAEDLMIFASAEFGFVRLADRHARASKVMPQKRNPFALAFIRAAANRLIGMQAGIAAAARTPSGQMDNRLFAYEAVPDALRSAAEAARLTAECVAGLVFDETRAEAALDDRSACASDLAERLMPALGIDYRRAHGLVGRLVRRLEEGGRSLGEAKMTDIGQILLEHGLPGDALSDKVLADSLDPTACVSARRDVGGAAREEVFAMSAALSGAIAEHRHTIEIARGHRETAFRRLQAEAESFARHAR